MSSYESNPLILFETLNQTLRRYIPTTLPISRRYPQLQQAFRELLDDQELVKGPYIEALPDFEKGRHLRTLLRENGGFLHNNIGNLPNNILDRPLHAHQEKALIKATQKGESI